MGWSREFPAEYKPPDEILSAAGVVDQSWGNDVCPSFTTKELADLPHVPGEDPRDLRLWSDHPDPEMREFPDHKRYGVVDHTKGVTRWEGEDPVLAVIALRLWAAAALFEEQLKRTGIMTDSEGPDLGESRR